MLNPGQFLRKSLKDYELCRLFLVEQLDKLDVSYLDSYANFITIDLGKASKSIFNRLLKSGIILRPLDNYELPNYLRLTIGTMKECKLFISALKEILSKNK